MMRVVVGGEAGWVTANMRGLQFGCVQSQVLIVWHQHSTHEHAKATIATAAVIFSTKTYNCTFHVNTSSLTFSNLCLELLSSWVSFVAAVTGQICAFLLWCGWNQTTHLLLFETCCQATQTGVPLLPSPTQISSTSLQRTAAPLYLKGRFCRQSACDGANTLNVSCCTFCLMVGVMVALRKR